MIDIIFIHSDNQLLDCSWPVAPRIGETVVLAHPKPIGAFVVDDIVWDYHGAKVVARVHLKPKERA